MSQVSKIEVPVEAGTAAALSDSRRLEAVGRLVRPAADDKLMALLEHASGEALQGGLTEDEIEAERAAYNAERRA